MILRRSLLFAESLDSRLRHEVPGEGAAPVREAMLRSAFEGGFRLINKEICQIMRYDGCLDCS
jgi:hypothetical protein